MRYYHSSKTNLMYRTDGDRVWTRFPSTGDFWTPATYARPLDLLDLVKVGDLEEITYVAEYLR